MRYIMILLMILTTFLVYSRDYSKRAWKLRKKALDKKESVAYCRSFNPVLFKKIQDDFYRGISEYDLKHYQFSAEIFENTIFLCENIVESKKYSLDIKKCEQKMRISEDIVEKCMMYDGMLFYKNKLEKASNYLNIGKELLEKGIYAYENGLINIINRRRRIDNILANSRKINELLKNKLEKLKMFHELTEQIRILEDKIEAYKNSWIVSKESSKFAMLKDWFSYEKEKYLDIKSHLDSSDTKDIYEISNKFNEFDIALIRLIRSPRYLTVIKEYNTTKWNELIKNSNKKMLYVIKKGDCLWTISSKLYKDPVQWRKLYKMNKDIIEKPELIYPKEVLKY